MEIENKQVAPGNCKKNNNSPLSKFGYGNKLYLKAFTELFYLRGELPFQTAVLHGF